MMHRSHIGYLLIALLTSQPVFALETHDAYLRLTGGISKMEDQVFHYRNGTKLTTQFDDGSSAGAAIGFRWNTHWRTDISLEKLQNDNDIVTINSTRDGSTGGEMHAETMLLNFYYDFFPDRYTHWRPYAGVGGGIMRIKWQLTDTSTTASSQATKIAYHGTIGIGYQFNPDWRLNLNYRRLQSGRYDSNTGTNIPSTSNPTYQNNNVNLELILMPHFLG